MPLAHNLPVFRTSFVGRETELREVLGHLGQADSRLVSIVGRSGIGKTRLAIEAARVLPTMPPGGPAYVDLSETVDPTLIATLVAGALGTATVAGQSAEDAIRRTLRHSAALLIVDDIDHAVGALDVLLDLASLSRGTCLLVTAHRALDHPLERMVRLGSLAVPADDVTDPDEIRTSPAVVLYGQRAAAVDPGFSITASNARTIAELTRRFDGLPLAIELGAARARLLSPQGQLDALADDTALELRSVPRDDRPERHRHVRSVVAGSYGLAGEQARVVLRRMSVFAAAATSPRLREVVAMPGWSLADVLDALTELLDLGLVEVDPGGDGEPRFRLHPTVAAYGREQLAANDDPLEIKRRYQATFRAAARRTRTMPETKQLEMLGRESTEFHSVFAQLATARSVEDALELAADLAPHWAQRGLFQGPGSTFAGLLDEAEGSADVSPGILSRAMLWWCRLVIHGAEPARSRDAVVRRVRSGTDAARAIGDAELLLFALETAVLAIYVTGDMPGAAAATMEAMPLAAASGDDAALRRFRYRAAMVALATGQASTAAQLAALSLDDALRAQDIRSVTRAASVLRALPEGTPGIPPVVPGWVPLLEASRRAGDTVEVTLLQARLAADEVLAGRVGEGAAWALRGLDQAQHVGAWYAGGLCIAALVLAADSSHDDAAVARLHGSLTSMLSEILLGIGPFVGRYRAAVAAAREHLGDAAFDEIAAGAALLDRDETIEAAAAYARTLLAVAPATLPGASSGVTLVIGQQRSTDRQHRTAGVDGLPASASPLTPRELDVLRALMTGATNREVGQRLGLRPKTVMHHSVAIYSKLGVRGRTEATAWAYRQGMTGDSAELAARGD